MKNTILCNNSVIKTVRWEIQQIQQNIYSKQTSVDQPNGKQTKSGVMGCAYQSKQMLF